MVKSGKIFGVLLILTCICLGGCAGIPGKNQTGLAYILEQAEQLKAGRPENKLKPAVKPAKHLNTARFQSQPRKTAYLTFDDGPDSINTPVILDILDNYGVKATFFVVGTMAEKNPAILKEIVRRGHALGNHTYNHRYSDVYSGAAGFMNSIKTNEEVIFRITGRRPRLVRDPGGEVRNSKAFEQILARNGYRLVDWNVDSYDSRKPSSDGVEIIENIRRQSQKKYLWAGMIILMHDGKGHLNTVRALPTVLEMMLHQGFEFKTWE